MIKANMKLVWLWGESAFPYLFNIIKYLEVSSEGVLAQSFLDGLFIAIIRENAWGKEDGLPNPYYSISDLFEALFGISTRTIDLKEFSGASYMLWILIFMQARRNQRQILQDNWRKLSRINLHEFRIRNPEDIFSWRADGINHSEFPRQTQSWVELQKEAMNFDGAPKLLTERLDLLRFFILVCPHRATKMIMGLLDR
jgi:hypothetical protein